LAIFPYVLGLGYTYFALIAPIIYQIHSAKIKDRWTNPRKRILLRVRVHYLVGKVHNLLENEIEILKSYRILSQVVNELHLDLLSFYEVGNVKT